jgi:hypothetical protein
VRGGKVQEKYTVTACLHFLSMGVVQIGTQRIQNLSLENKRRQAGESTLKYQTLNTFST